MLSCSDGAIRAARPRGVHPHRDGGLRSGPCRRGDCRSPARKPECFQEGPGIYGFLVGSCGPERDAGATNQGDPTSREHQAHTGPRLGPGSAVTEPDDGLLAGRSQWVAPSQITSGPTTFSWQRGVQRGGAVSQGAFEGGLSKEAPRQGQGQVRGPPPRGWSAKDCVLIEDSPSVQILTKSHLDTLKTHPYGGHETGLLENQERWSRSPLSAGKEGG